MIYTNFQQRANPSHEKLSAKIEQIEAMISLQSSISPLFTDKIISFITSIFSIATKLKNALFSFSTHSKECCFFVPKRSCNIFFALQTLVFKRSASSWFSRRFKHASIFESKTKISASKRLNSSSSSRTKTKPLSFKCFEYAFAICSKSLGIRLSLYSCSISFFMTKQKYV